VRTLASALLLKEAVGLARWLATWWRSRCVRNTASPVCDRMKSAQVRSATDVRVNSTSPIG
jgi:hypothetical protein